MIASIETKLNPRPIRKMKRHRTSRYLHGKSEPVSLSKKALVLGLAIIGSVVVAIGLAACSGGGH